jgi:hypothetical protein
MRGTDKSRRKVANGSELSWRDESTIEGWSVLTSRFGS